MGLIIGIDVGGTKIAYGLFDEQHRLLKKKVEKSRPELFAHEFIDMLCEHIDELLCGAGADRAALSGVGVAFPGHIHAPSGVILTLSNLPKWKSVPVRELLREKLGVRVEIENDANAAAIAEHRVGAGKGTENMIYITVSTGIGGGLILNNKIFHGSFGAAGEIGHMLISDLYGTKCGCGNIGCVESICSGPHVVHYIQKRISEGAPSCMRDMAPIDELTTYHLARAASEKDLLAIETIEHVARYLSRLFASLYQMLNIDTVVYGGGLTKVSPLLMQRAKEGFEQLVEHAKDYPVKYIPSVLTDDVSIIGAGLLIG